jgi:hypothetical protein
MVLPLDSVMGSKRKCKSDKEAKKGCKDVTPDNKIKILDKLRGGVCAVAVGLTLRWCFVFMFIFAVALSYVTQFVHK